MKKGISIFVLSMFLMHFFGFYVYFVVRQGQIRQEMRESIGMLPNEEFEVFVFTVEEYHKVRVNDFEVKIKGKMYDHSAPKFENGKIILLARHDKDEDNLISFLSAVVSSSNEDDQPIPSQLLSFFSLTFISDSPLSINAFLDSEKLNHPSLEKILSIHFPVASPPPKM